jgi:type IX secretion system PorP/SprF family membrane protein
MSKNCPPSFIPYQRVVCIAIAVCLCVISTAQQQWSYTQYQFNLFDANSAYAGNHQTVSVSVRHRAQWIGMEGAPSTDQMAVHAPIAGNRFGVGLRIVSDRIGARRQQLVKTSAAYKLKWLNGQLAFGLTAGVLRNTIERNELNAFDVNDAQLAQLGTVNVTPVVGAAFMYTSSHCFIGVESGYLNQAPLTSTEGSLARIYRNANAVAGWLHAIGDNNLLEVSTQIKWTEGNQLQAEINAQYLYRNKAWIGGGYRFGSAWQMLVAWEVSDQFRVGLSYDNTVGRVINSNQSSAELFLGYTLQKRTAGSVRYF